MRWKIPDEWKVPAVTGSDKKAVHWKRRAASGFIETACERELEREKWRDNTTADFRLATCRQCREAAVREAPTEVVQ